MTRQTPFLGDEGYPSGNFSSKNLVSQKSKVRVKLARVLGPHFGSCLVFGNGTPGYFRKSREVGEIL